MANKKYRILCLDGGGIRGVITATILKKVVAKYGSFLENIDLIAGTSTGGILTLALAAGLAPAQLVEFYEEYGAIIFEDTIWDDILDLWAAIGAEYGNKNLKRAIKDTLAKAGFGENATLGDLEQKVLISSFDLDNKLKRDTMQAPYRPGYEIQSWKPKFFHNFEDAHHHNADLDEKILDVAMRTSAAPTYFPTYGRFVDGGVIANNPSMCALAQALDVPGEQIQLKDICLLSIGTGHRPQFVAGENHDWGWYQWIVQSGQRRIINIMMDGSVGLTDYQCKQILNKRYYRCNPILKHNIGLDDFRAIQELIRTVDDDHKLLDELFVWIDDSWIPEADD